MGVRNWGSAKVPLFACAGASSRWVLRLLAGRGAGVAARGKVAHLWNHACRYLLPGLFVRTALHMST